MLANESSVNEPSEESVANSNEACCIDVGVPQAWDMSGLEDCEVR